MLHLSSRFQNVFVFGLSVHPPNAISKECLREFPLSLVHLDSVMN